MEIAIVEAPDEEKPALRVAHRAVQGRSYPAEPMYVRLAAGELVELPAAACKGLSIVLEVLAERGTLSIVPPEAELSTQQAADLLNVSRPYLVKLLDQGQIRHTLTVGKHRRVLFSDVAHYKARRDEQRRDGLLQLLAELEPEPALEAALSR